MRNISDSLHLTQKVINKHTMYTQIKNTRFVRRIAYACMTISVLFLFSFIALPETMPSLSYGTADSYSTPTLSLSTSNVAFTTQPGGFNSGSQTVSVATTNYTGYALSLTTSNTNFIPS